MFAAITTETATTITKLSLVQDLAIIMLAAGLSAVIFHWRGWPKVIGYIFTGILMGSSVFRPLLITNEGSINVLANLGVIFLMFTLGLEMNIRKLRKIGGIVFPTALADLLLMLLAGYAFGHYVLHWDLLPSLFLGAVVCDSSTTLLAKSLEEMGCSKEHFATVIFGTTITEDVMTIGIMAVLTALALTGQFQATELLKQLGELSCFLIGVAGFGLLLLPKFLDWLSGMKDDETQLIVILGICFGLSFIAEKLNYSLALGAFLVGAVCSESNFSKQIKENTFGLRNMFSAVFFVTIGLMVDLPQMWHNWQWILAVSLLVIICKTANCMLASYAMGQPHKDAIATGVGLAQIGDFAYLVAMMGMTLNNNEAPYPAMYQIAVGVSVLTTLVNPFLLKKSRPFADWLDKKLPENLRNWLERYTAWTKRADAGEKNKHSSKFKRCLLLFIVYLILIATLFMIAQAMGSSIEVKQRFKFLWMQRHFGEVVWLGFTLLASPLIITAFRYAEAIAQIVTEATLPSFIGNAHLPAFLTKENSPKIWVQLIRGLVRGLAIYILFVEYMMASAILIRNMYLMLALFVACVIFLRFFWKRVKQISDNAHKTLQNILDREDEDYEIEFTSSQYYSTQLPKASGAIGMTIGQLNLRSRTGATIAKIKRQSGEIVTMLTAETLIQKDDTLFLKADDKQMPQCIALLRQTEIKPANKTQTQTNIAPAQITVPETSPVCGKNLKELKLRNATGVTIIRIVRGDETIDNPGADTVLLAKDTLHLLGKPGQIDQAKKLLLQQKTGQ